MMLTVSACSTTPSQTRIIETDCSAALDLDTLEPGQLYPPVQPGEDLRVWGEGITQAYLALRKQAWAMHGALTDCREAAGETNP